jgi:hypothetical protein
MTQSAPESITYDQALLATTREQLSQAMAANADLVVQVRVANQRAEDAERALAAVPREAGVTDSVTT